MLTYIGKGYSPAFTANYSEVVSRLSAGEDIEVGRGPDEICRPLLADVEPHCLRTSVDDRDATAAEDLGKLLRVSVEDGVVIKLDEKMLDRMRKAFRSGVIRPACGGCEWFNLCSTISKAGYPGAQLHRG